MSVRGLSERGVQIGLPIVAALVVAPFSVRFEGFWPWDPRMVDLEVYRYIGEVLRDGGDILSARTPRDGLAFIYPPFAALLCLPLVVVPLVGLKIGWLAGTALALLAVLHRLGLTGWQLSLVGTVCVFFVEPVRETLGFGQVNVFVLALVVCDLVPGPRLLSGRRWLPCGIFTGLATAVKVTPALFVVYLLFARQWRTARNAVATMAAATLVGAAFLPGESLTFWRLLLEGETRTGYASFLFNQSVLAATLRFAGESTAVAYVGLAVGAVVAFVGAYAAACWHRRSTPDAHASATQPMTLFAVSLCGVATLLASPLSWTHHFVWVVPLAGAVAARELPFVLRAVSAAFVVWVAAAVFKGLPWGERVELTYGLAEQVLSAVTPLLGLVLVGIAFVTGNWPRRRAGRSAAEPIAVQ